MEIFNCPTGRSLKPDATKKKRGPDGVKLEDDLFQLAALFQLDPIQVNQHFFLVRTFYLTFLDFFQNYTFQTRKFRIFITAKRALENREVGKKCLVG